MTPANDHATALYHGTGRQFETLEPQYGTCTDCGGSFPGPVLMLTPSLDEAKYYASLDGGCGSGDATGENPTVWTVEVHTTIVDMTDAEIEDWMIAIEDGDEHAPAVRCTGRTYAERGTVILTPEALYDATVA